LPDLQISQIHGQPKRLKLRMKQSSDEAYEVVILPLFHPAAALYNGGMRQTLLDDFSRIPAIIKKLTNN
jgi:DNA polymerase